MINSNISIGVLSIATNINIDYWEKMVISFDNKIQPDQKCSVHVFSDQVERAKEVANKLANLSVRVYEIPPYKWPDATIRRYEIFSKFSNDIDETILMHLDADMIILENIFLDFSTFDEEKEIFLVAHPGYWNVDVSVLNRIKAFLRRTKPVRGSWETRVESQAFVEANLRKSYVCGGIWAGKRDAFFALTEELANAVEIDRTNSIMAVWHDESHLNKWASQHDYLLLTPEYCFVGEYRHLRGLKPKVVAVTKDERTR